MVSGSHEILNGYNSPSPKKNNKFSPSSKKGPLLSGEKLASRSMKKIETSVDDEEFTPKRKLKPEECESLYARMMLYEHRKRKAI